MANWLNSTTPANRGNSMAGLDACLGAARSALAGFELQALPLAAIAGALLLVVLIRALLAQRVPSISVEPITGASQGHCWLPAAAHCAHLATIRGRGAAAESMAAGPASGGGWRRRRRRSVGAQRRVRAR